MGGIAGWLALAYLMLLGPLPLPDAKHTFHDFAYLPALLLAPCSGVINDFVCMYTNSQTNSAY